MSQAKKTWDYYTLDTTEPPQSSYYSLHHTFKFNSTFADILLVNSDTS